MSNPALDGSAFTVLPFYFVWRFPLRKSILVSFLLALSFLVVGIPALQAQVKHDPGVNEVALAAPKLAALSSASINVAVSGDTALVAAVGGQTVRIHKMWFVCNGSVNVIFKDGAGGTALNGVVNLSSGGGIFFPFDSEPWFTTSSSNAFVINLSGSQQCSGRVYYTQS